MVTYIIGRKTSESLDEGVVSDKFILMGQRKPAGAVGLRPGGPSSGFAKDGEYSENAGAISGHQRSYF